MYAAHWQYTPYTLPLIAVAAILVGLAVVTAWKRRAAPGVESFILLLLALSEWALVYALDLASVEFQSKIFWARAEYLGVVVVPAVWLIFVMYYTNRERWLRWWTILSLSVVPLVTLTLAWTDGHNLIWESVTLDTTGSFTALNVDYGLWFWVNAAYSYLLLLVGTVWLVQAFISSSRLHRGQTAALLVSALVPWAGNVLFVAGVHPQGLDLTPFAFTLSALIVAWALFRFQLLDLSPIARHVVIENMADAVIVLDMQNRILDLNPSAEKIIGQPASALVGHSIDHIGLDWRGLVEQCDGTVKDFQTEIVLGDEGTRHHYELQVSILRDRDSNPLGRLVTLRDVTERKRVLEALQRSEDKYRTIFETTGAATVIIEADTTIALANREFERLSGYSKEELEGRRKWTDFVPEDELERMLAFHDARRVQPEAAPDSYEFEFIDGHGTHRAVLANVAMIPGTQLSVASLADITERKETERALALERDMLQGLMNNVPDWIFFKDVQSRFTRVNQAHAQFLGASGPQDVAGLTDFDFFPAEDAQRFYEEEQEIIRSGEPMIGRVAPTPAQDGETLWRSETKVPMTDDETGEVIGLIGISRDVTALKAAEEEIRQRAEEAETLREAGAVVAGTLQQDEAIERILEQLARVVPYASASVQLLADGYLEIVGGRGWFNVDEVKGLRFPIPGDNPNTVVVEARQPYILSNAPAEYPPFDDSPHDHIRSWLGIPLIAHQEVIGMLAVDSTETDYFTSRHVRLASAFADQVAIAVQNVRLFEQMRAALDRTQSLYQVSRSLIGLDNLEETLQTVVNSVAAALPADRVTLITFDMESESVTTFVKGGPGKGKVVQVSFAELMAGLSGWVLRKQLPALSSKEQLDPREGPSATQRRAETDCGAVMVVPLRYLGTPLGTMTAINRPHERDFTQQDVDLMMAMANQATIAIKNAWLFGEVQRLAITDQLTGLYNRRGFLRLGRREVERARRFERPLSALMVDIDRFKQVNDRYGHSAGDQVLRHLAERWDRSLREVDVLGRYGGDEFVVLLPETGLSVAYEVAERLRWHVAHSHSTLHTTEGPVNITISVGVAELNDDHHTLEYLLNCADEALYAAKQAGRNRVRVCQAGEEAT